MTTEDDGLREPRAPEWGAREGYAPTPDDIDEWEEYERAYRRWEELSNLAHAVNLAPLLAGEFELPEMLPGGRIVAGTSTTVAGPRAQGKTWFVAETVVQVIKAGGNAVWVDFEMGRVRTAERFKTLGLTPEEAAGLAYFESPALPGEHDEPGWRPFWAMLMQARTPAIVVVDAHTEALSVAGLDDYRGGDVAKWHAWYATPALNEGAAFVYIDHVPHDKKRAIGASHKENQAKVVLVIEQTKPFDREHVGEILVTCTKNSFAAAIPDKQHYQIGTNPLTGRFVFEPVPERVDLSEGSGSEKLDGIGKAKNRITVLLKDKTELDALSTTDIKQMAGGKAEFVVKALAELVEHDLISAGKQGRSVMYWERVPD